MKVSTVLVAALVFFGGVFLFWATRPYPHQELLNAIKSHDISTIRALINERISSTDPQFRHIWKADNIRLGYGRTPLHVAAKYCTTPEPMKVLLESYKCDPNAKNNIDRATPLHAAAAFDVSGLCVLMLLTHGANAMAPSSAGWTPLFSATAYDNAAALRLLLGAGVDPNHGVQISPEETDYPLALALRRGHAAAVYWLFRYGASVPDTHAEYEKYTALVEQATRHCDIAVASGQTLDGNLRACLPPPPEKTAAATWQAVEALARELGYRAKVLLPEEKVSVVQPRINTTSTGGDSITRTSASTTTLPPQADRESESGRGGSEAWRGGYHAHREL